MTTTEMAEAVREYARQTIGTGQWYRHWTGRLHYTDGIHHLAETCGAHWLVDLVASHQPRVVRRLARYGFRNFQVWELRQEPDGSWVAEAWTDTPRAKASEDGPASRRLVRQRIEFSDFPAELSPYRWWVVEGVMLLPEEY